MTLIPIIDAAGFMRTVIRDMLQTGPSLTRVETFTNDVSVFETGPGLQPDPITLDTGDSKIVRPRLLRDLCHTPPPIGNHLKSAAQVCGKNTISVILNDRGNDAREQTFAIDQIRGVSFVGDKNGNLVNAMTRSAISGNL
jgi:chemotaxis response regulator CheB